MLESLSELEQLSLSWLEIRFHGLALLTLVQEVRRLSDEVLPPVGTQLINYHWYHQTFNTFKEQIQLTINKTWLNSELLASRRQINRLISVFGG